MITVSNVVAKTLGGLAQGRPEAPYAVGGSAHRALPKNHWLNIQPVIFAVFPTGQISVSVNTEHLIIQ